MASATLAVLAEPEKSHELWTREMGPSSADQFEEPVPAKRIRRLIAVPRSVDIEDAMARLRQHGAHVARTVDDEGVTLGLIFLEDVLEILVGEISDATAA